MGDIIDMDTREKLNPDYFFSIKTRLPATMWMALDPAVGKDTTLIKLYGTSLIEIADVIEHYHSSASELTAVKKDGYWTVTIEKVD